MFGNFWILSAIAFAFTAVKAQSACDSVASAIPSCGQPCIISAGSAIGCSASTDYRCQCTSSSELQASALPCVISACGIQVGLAVQASASAVCSCIATATPDAPPIPTTGPTPGSSAPEPSVSITGGSISSEPSTSLPEPSGSAGPVGGTTISDISSNCETVSRVGDTPIPSDEESPDFPPPSTLTTVPTPPGTEPGVQVTVTKTVYYSSCTDPVPTTSSCQGLEGADYFFCCFNKVFTIGA